MSDFVSRAMKLHWTRWKSKCLAFIEYDIHLRTFNMVKYAFIAVDWKENPTVGWWVMINIFRLSLFVNDNDLACIEAKGMKYSFRLQKRFKISIWQDFLILDSQIANNFICYFWLMTILSSQKSKNTKYRFGLQKGIKNSILQYFLIRNLQIEGTFICYIWLMTVLSTQNLKNAKYSFWLQNGFTNSILQDFLIRDHQIVGTLIRYFFQNHFLRKIWILCFLTLFAAFFLGWRNF